MPTNTAAWINAETARSKSAPPPSPRPARTRSSSATTPSPSTRSTGSSRSPASLAYRWLNYPTVLGSDVAGEVVEVGSAVTRFRVGDRVLGHAVGTDKDSNRAAEGGFQHYTVVLERHGRPIPDTLSFEDAAVLPLAVSTAACGLFQTDQLGLRHPTANAEPTGQTRAGLGRLDQRRQQRDPAGGRGRLRGHHHRLAAQLRPTSRPSAPPASSTTAAPTVVDDIIAAFKGPTLAGAIAIGTALAPRLRPDRGCQPRQPVRVHRHPAGDLRERVLAAAHPDRHGRRHGELADRGPAARRTDEVRLRVGPEEERGRARRSSGTSCPPRWPRAATWPCRSRRWWEVRWPTCSTRWICSARASRPRNLWSPSDPGAPGARIGRSAREDRAVDRDGRLRVSTARRLPGVSRRGRPAGSGDAVAGSGWYGWRSPAGARSSPASWSTRSGPRIHRPARPTRCRLSSRGCAGPSARPAW